MPIDLEREERSMLGHALGWEQMQPDFFSLVREEYFFTDSHRRIVRAMRRLYDRESPVEFYSLTTELTGNSEIDAVGGVSYIASLTEGLISVYDVPAHMETLRDMWARRELIKRMERAMATAYDGATSAAALCDLLAQDVQEIECGRSTETFAIKDFLLDELDLITKERNAQPGALGIPTGISGLDEITTGLRQGELTVIGAWPGRGKTSLMLQMARSAGRAGYPSLIISLEMRKEELGRRLLALEARLSYRKLRDPREMTPMDYQNCYDAAGKLLALPVYICDESSLNPTQITSLAKLWIRKAGIKLVLVDFIQIVNESGRDTREAVNKISSGLRKLAKTSQVPVVAASQLGRPRDRNLNEKPTLFHLRESGNLEQDAHNVLMLYRPVDDNQDFTGDDEIIIAKQRHGVIGSVPVNYNSRQLIFEDRHV